MKANWVWPGRLLSIHLRRSPRGCWGSGLWARGSSVVAGPAVCWLSCVRGLAPEPCQPRLLTEKETISLAASGTRLFVSPSETRGW